MISKFSDAITGPLFAGETDMGTQEENRLGDIGAVRERPLLFVVLAASLFVGALLVAKGLETPPSIEARIRTEVVKLADDSEDPASLIKPATFDSDDLRKALLATPTPQAEKRRTSLLGAGWQERLTITNGDETGEFVITLDGDDAPQSVDGVNDLVSAVVYGLNRRRAEQKDKALAWIENKAAAWEVRIDQAKGAILQNPFDPDLSRSGGPAASEKLLRQMINAMNEAQSSQPAKDRESGTTNGSAARANGLASDVDRLKGALADLEAGRAAQLEHGKVLKEAEAGLTRLREGAGKITAEGALLDRPAAVVLAPASVIEAGTPTYLWAVGWPVLVPAFAALSIVLALLATVIACRIRPPVEVAADDYLNDPNWPHPPSAQREFSH